MPIWDPKQYELFLQERTQPSRDLAGRAGEWLGESPQDVIDIGCGPGNSTAVLAEAFPTARVTGVDVAPEMVARAASAHPELRFAAFDAAEETAYAPLTGQFDLVFSNACIQWIPDHQTLLPRLMSLLRPGGVLAVQTPLQAAHPMHQLICQVAEEPRWREKVPHRVFHNLEIPQYFDLLATLTDTFTLWETIYMHRLPAHQHVLEWYRGSGLRPYLQALNNKDAAAFEAEILAGVRKLYPPQANGELLFAFPRLFLMAKKG